ncbi:AAA family ATPase [Desulfovibrio subterraneus]|uniref:AAA family ATPase n=1 Tax=Desulfovibrio subterraneus TaxID=2718620 RepID=UPI0022B8C9BA|nr:AAA family ATPase [Desulfovibrio subterraneus]WBF66929.1 AAA family ATPase [Desulfovibrio subterraneus]
MKIAIYGVSRAGKDYLIEKVVAQLNAGDQMRALHMKGSATLNILAKKNFNTSFKALTEEKKESLRREFVRLMEKNEAEYDVVLVDGHYAFMDGKEYRVVFTEDDRNAYDAFFYLDTPSERIVQFSQNSQGDKKNAEITAEEVRLWKSFEKDQMTSLCRDLNKELMVLAGKTAVSVEVITSYVSRQRIAERNRDILKSKITDIAKQQRTELTILLDADGTLIPYDSAEIMAKFLNDINVDDIKTIFKRYDAYCFSAFYDVAKYYSSNNSYDDFVIASERAAKEVEIRSEFIQLFDEVDANFIILTAGFSLLWRNVIEKYNLKNISLIAGNTLYDECIVGQSEKGFVVDVLKSMGKSVICFGDALVDRDMFLKSDLGYLMLDERKRSIIPHLENDYRFEYVSFGSLTIESMKHTTFDEIKRKIQQVSAHSFESELIEVVEGIL